MKKKNSAHNRIGRFFLSMVDEEYKIDTDNLEKKDRMDPDYIADLDEIDDDKDSQIKKM